MYYVRPALYTRIYQLFGLSSNEDPLIGSIEKWEFVVDWLERHPGESLDDRQGSTCPLCHAYDDWCLGCPIQAFTGQNQCRGTPYSHYRDTFSLSAAQDVLDLLHEVANANAG